MEFILRTLLLSFFLFFSSFAFSQTEKPDGLVFDAENATIEGFDKNNQIIKLNKNVKIIIQGQYIECDKASIFTAKKEFHCTGNVRLVGPDAKLLAEELILNYEKNTGEIKNGFVQVDQVLFEGEQIKKTGPKTYETIRGYYTACHSCPAFWSFRGSKLTAEMGEYAFIKNARLYFGKVPALWLPYLIVPIKTERQSGLLFPDYELSSSKGFTISPSFFWAIDESSDATITSKYYTEKGLKGLFQYRYMLSDVSKGQLDFAYLQDKTFSRSDDLSQYNPNREILDRWFFKYNHIYEMPYDFIQRINVNSVSDTRYPIDFREEIHGRGEPSLENQASITKNFESLHSNINASYYRSLMYENPLSTNKDSVHRFPEINLNLMPQKILGTNILFDTNINYINFARDSRSYDNLDANRNTTPTNASDDAFDPSTDIIRTGQRLDIEPSLSYPLNFGTIASFVPSVSFRETRYQFSLGDDPTTYRHYLKTNFSSQMQASSIFGDLSNPISTRIKHVVQPELNYSYIPWSEQDNHPFFQGEDFDSNFRRDQPVSNNDNIQFDYRDRVFEKNLATFAITNKFLRKKFLKTGSPDYKQIISHKLMQSYDIHEDRRFAPSSIRKQPWSEITSILNISFDYIDTASTVKYYPYQDTYSHYWKVRLHNGEGEYFETTYSQDFLITNNTRVDVNTKTEDLVFGAGFDLRYLSMGGSTTYNVISDKIQSYQYSLKLKPPGNCWALVFKHEKLVNTEQDFQFGFSFLFDGKTETNIGSKSTLVN